MYYQREGNLSIAGKDIRNSIALLILYTEAHKNTNRCHVLYMWGSIWRHFIRDTYAEAIIY